MAMYILTSQCGFFRVSTIGISRNGMINNLRRQCASFSLHRQTLLSALWVQFFNLIMGFDEIVIVVQIAKKSYSFLGTQ